MSNPPGLMLPTAKSYLPGAGNPRDSAIMAQQMMDAKQQSLNSAVGGRRRKMRRGGAASPVVVPQFQMPYTTVEADSASPNAQIKGLSSTSMQSTSWAANDKLAAKMGGSKKWRKRKSQRRSRRGYKKSSRRYTSRRR